MKTDIFAPASWSRGTSMMSRWTLLQKHMSDLRLCSPRCHRFPRALQIKLRFLTWTLHTLAISVLSGLILSSRKIRSESSPATFRSPSDKMTCVIVCRLLKFILIHPDFLSTEASKLDSSIALYVVSGGSWDAQISQVWI